jgi:hypothetical protein
MPAQPIFGGQGQVASTAEQSSVGSSSGHPVGSPETVTLAHPLITNPEIKAAAQVMRATSITDTSNTTNENVSQGVYVPALVPDTTTTFNVKSQISVSQNSLVTQNDFTLEVTARDSRKIPLDKKIKKIDHQMHVKRYLTVTIPPKITASPGPDGAVYIEIIQQDPVASSVVLYYRIFSITGGTPYKKITEIEISKQDGPKMHELGVTIAGTCLVRAVPICREKSSGLFTDIVVRPFTSISQKSAEDMTHGVLQSYPNASGIFVKASTIIGNCNFACIARKNISASEKIFTKISDYKKVNNGVHGIEHQDDDVQLGETYEYRLQFLMPDGTELLNKHSTTMKRVQTFPTPGIVISRFVTTPANASGKFGVRFNISTDRKAKSAESVISSSLKKLGLAGQYKDQISQGKDMSNKLYFFHVIRKNLITGGVDDFGFVPPGTFSDTGADDKRIDLPHQAYAYEYCIELMCRDPEQILEELMNTKALRQSKSFNQSPVVGKAQVATTAKVNPNTKSKYFSSHSLIQSTISTGDALVKNHSGGSLGMSGTGNIKVFPVSLPVSTNIKIKNGKVSSNEFGDVFLEWQSIGTGKVDHFIITAARTGFSYPCGVCHHVSTANRYMFVDRTQKTVPGVITYTITPIMLDFTKGEQTLIGQVVVVGD